MSDLSEKICTRFPEKNIIIIGDLVADQFLRGTIERVSREAPVFILRHDETETLAGGAANATVNVSTLGGNAFPIGLIGADENGRALTKTLKDTNVNCDYVISSEKVQTTTKVRVLAGQHYARRQQVIRIDYENKNKVDSGLREQIKQNLIKASEQADAIIISDYNYGVADGKIGELANKIASEKDIPLLIDSRFNLETFPNVTTATPNQEEVEQILGNDFSEQNCVELCKKLGYEALLVTLGNKGMLLIEKNREPKHFGAIGPKEPVDVTGAGDTVIAAYALGLASGLDFSQSARIANHAGGIVVMKKGTASANLQELLESLEKHGQNGEFKTQTR